MKASQVIAIREHYETQLAHSVLKNPQLVPSVTKVSNAIIELIDLNKESIVNLSKESIAIEEEMNHPDYFGRFVIQKDTCNTPLKTLQDLRDVLTNPSSPLELVMHVHAVFMGKVYDKLPKQIPPSLLTSSDVIHDPSYSNDIANKIRQNPQDIKNIKFGVVKDIFMNELFYKGKNVDRSRNQKQVVVPRSEKIGINHASFFDALAPNSDYPHLRAADNFTPDLSANYTIKAQAKQLPLVAGPSGNAGGLILCACVCGDLSQEEMKEYGLATIAYLEGGGNHAFHEIGSVLAKVGIPHDMGAYEATLPSTYVNSKAYSDVKNDFKKLLVDYISQKKLNQEPIQTADITALYETCTGERFEPSQLAQQIKNGTCLHDWESFDEIGGRDKKVQPVCSIKPITVTQPAVNGAIDSMATYRATLSASAPIVTPWSSSVFSLLSVGTTFLNSLSLFTNYKYPVESSEEVKAKSAELKFQLSNDEAKANLILKSKGGSLDAAMSLLCGKYQRREAHKADIIKDFLIAAVINEGDVPSQLVDILAIENAHERFKAALSLAKTYEQRHLNTRIR